MKDFTLWIIICDDKILLWSKKKTNSWFTISLWKRNWPWWAVEENESIEDWLIREVKEEMWAEISKVFLEKTWVIDFYFETKPIRNKKCHIFNIKNFNQPYYETDEMKREWFDVNNLPLDNMRDSDKIWLPKVLSWKYINYKIYSDDKWNLERVEKK